MVAAGLSVVPERRFPPPWSVEELARNERHPANDTRASGNAQGVGMAAYELDAFKPNLRRAEAEVRRS